MDPTPKPIVANCNVAAAGAPTAATPIGRSNTVFGSLKWWPLSSSASASSSNNSSSSPNIAGGAAAGGSASCGLHVAPQKLRESKWFTQDESRVLCAVAEPGFVVEIREGQENESSYGVLLFKASKGAFRWWTYSQAATSKLYHRGFECEPNHARAFGILSNPMNAFVS